ncbi:hypothetical protein B2J86_01635 [Acidovorax sp. SRB_14]|nr:hypothetical protein [Acidovorax sp. SRB_14]NMM87124.1 hypothetical protein [Rhodococcus sp. SRB_17]
MARLSQASSEIRLRIHFMQRWFKVSDTAMEEALHDVSAFRDFAGLFHWGEYIPSESSILRFRHLLERHKLAEQILATGSAPCAGKDTPVDALIDQLERTRAGIRVKVEHPFRVLQQYFEYVKVRYRG